MAVTTNVAKECILLRRATQQTISIAHARLICKAMNSNMVNCTNEIQPTIKIKVENYSRRQRQGNILPKLSLRLNQTLNSAAKTAKN